MANAFWAAPAPPKVRPPNLWTGAQMTWTHPGSIDPETGEPRVWNLTDWRSGVLMLAGVTGMDLEESTRHTSEAATVHGSRFRSQRWGERQVFWPVSVCQMDGTQAWLDYDREWWDALNPRMTGVWRVTQPNGQWRELTCRPVSGGGHEWAKAPGLRYWTNYGVHLVAEDPFWYGPTITSPLWTSADPVDFIDSQELGPPYHPGSATTIDSATLTNPGKEDGYPTFVAAGGDSGISAFSVAIDGHELEYSEPILAGEVLEIRTDPTKSQGAWLNGENVNRYLSKHDFAPIPPGRTVPLSINMTGGGTLQASFRPKFDRAW